MQLFSADATIFFKKDFTHKKLKKTTLKSCLEKLKSTFFLIAWAAQTAQTFSKMRLIDQLYIEVGLLELDSIYIYLWAQKIASR